MNIDEALIERIIREVVSQVVTEKAAGGGQNPVIDKHHLVDKHRMPVDIIQKSQFMMWISRKILLPVK